MLDEFNKLRVDVHGALTEMSADLRAVVSMVQSDNAKLSSDAQKAAQAAQEEQLAKIAQKHEDLRQDFVEAAAGGLKVAPPDLPDVAGPMRKVMRDVRTELVKEVTKEVRAETRTVLAEVEILKGSVEELKLSMEFDELQEGSTQLQASVAALASHIREHDEDSTSILDELAKTRDDMQARIAELSERSSSERVPLELQAKLSDLVERPQLDLQPMMAAVEQLRQTAFKAEHFDLSPVLTVLGQVEASQRGDFAALKTGVKQLQQVAEEQQRQPPPLPVAIPPPEVDFEPVLNAIAAIDLGPLTADISALKSLGDASFEAIASLDLDALHGAVLTSDERREQCHAVAMELLKAIEEKPPPPPLDLSPVLSAVAADTGVVVQRIDAMQHASTSQVKAAAMETNSVFGAVKRVESRLESFDGRSILGAIKETGASMQAANAEILALAAKIDDKPAVDLSPLMEAIKKVDAKPPVSLLPVAERIGRVEKYMADELGAKLDKVDPAIADVRKALDRVEGCLPVDQRPTLKALSRIEKMLPVDLRPVLDVALRIDAKPPPNLEPLQLGLQEATEALKEVISELVPANTKQMLDALGNSDDQQQTLLHKVIALLSRIEQRPDQDMSPVIGCIARVGAKIDKLPPLDLEPVLQELSVTHAKIDALPSAPDFSPILDEVSRSTAHLLERLHVGLAPVLEAALSADSKLPQDLGSVLAAIDTVDGKTSHKLQVLLDLLTKVDMKPPVDLNPVLKSVEKCETALKKHLGPPVTQIMGDVTALIPMVKELMGRKDRAMMWKTPSAVW